MSWERAWRLINKAVPSRLGSYWSIRRLEREENLALLLKNPIRRKIALHYLRNNNNWSSISSLASDIKESKATVQDHLETMKEELLVERWFMNRRLFRMKPELYPELTPDPFLFFGFAFVVLLLVGYLLKPSETIAGMLAGILLTFIAYVIIESKES